MALCGYVGVNDTEIAKRVLSYISNDFKGRLLDVPTGTAVFTVDKYAELKQAEITGLDYSEDMLEQAKNRFLSKSLKNIHVLQGDVGKLPFEKESFDVVLSMNGFHAFPDKQAAYEETNRVLKKGGKFIACFYIRGETWITDMLVKLILAKKGWFIFVQRKKLIDSTYSKEVLGVMPALEDSEKKIIEWIKGVREYV